MKTLKAKGTLVTDFAITVPIGVLLLICIVDFTERNIDDVFGVVIVILLNLFAAYDGISIYCKNSITYGNGKIIVRHVGKEYVDGVAVGGWKIKEDEFLLEELEAYGMSWDILGHSVEEHPGTMVNAASEAFFRLKDGRTIGYVSIDYTRWQANELFRYIQEETGLEVQVLQPA